jgi:L-threonylcarbamoyladenylate synthase
MPTLAPTPAEIAAAGQRIRGGGLVAMPTETVYGLAGDATNGLAVAAIYATKGRPRFNPLIVHVADADAAWALAEGSPLARTLAERFWPGPLTLVLPARPGNGIADLATAGLDTIAIRVPAHPVARALIATAGRPLAAPSANRSGHVSPTMAAHVADDFGPDLMVLDGGPCAGGIESTILDLSRGGIRLLRAGGIAAETVAGAVDHDVGRLDPLTGAEPERPCAPGQLASHYAPRARVRLDAQHLEPGEALLAFGPEPLSARGPVINLSVRGDLAAAAAALFAALRTLDASGADAIAVMPIPRHGLGEAINDRLARAAAPRPVAHE